MDLTVDALNKQGGFTGGPVKRVVEWEHNGEMVSADVYIRPMSYQTTVGDLESHGAGGDIFARRLASSVCHADGSPVFRVSDITGIQEDGKPVMVKVDGKLEERGPLNKELTDALMLLVSEVSGLGKKRRSRESKSSGTS